MSEAGYDCSRVAIVLGSIWRGPDYQTHSSLRHSSRKLAIEAFDETILHGFTGSDIVPGNTALILPFQDRPTGQFAAIVADNSFWFAIEPDQAIKFAGDTLS